MDPAPLELWLRRRLRHDANVQLALAPFAILGALLVLTFTFGFSYMVIWMALKVVLAVPELATGTRWRVGHGGRLALTSGFLALLFISYLRSDRWQRQDWSTLGQNASEWGQALWRFGGGRAGLLLVHPEASARIIVDLLFIGPQLLVSGIRLLRDSGRLRAADTAQGSRILWTLLSEPRRVSYEELEAVYSAAELLPAFSALQHLTGVIFLEQGVTLTQELRQELAAAVREA